MKQWFSKFTQSLTIGHLLIGGILLTAVFYIGYGAGALQEERSGIRGAQVSTNTQMELGQDQLDFMQFWEVWQSVKDRYIESDISDRDLFYGAIGGIVEGLDDPYSTYFTPEDASAFLQDLEGSFYGIGAELDERDGGIVIVTPLKGTPAEEAGVRAGDFILEVDGNSTEGWSVYEAVDNIRGEEGTKVTLSLLTPGEGIKDVEITRGKITIDSVTWEQEDGIGIIQMTQFNQESLRLFNQAIEELNPESLDGLILDLRGNPGGLLDKAIAIADFWIDDRIVLVEKTRDTEINIRAGKGAILENIPTVVLVNGGSASASEIIAGALQDYELAHVIGTQTFGKGSVQDYEELKDGSALKITVARWFTPKGRSIDEVGIEPDEVITLTQEDFDAEKDTQLEAARLYIKDAR